MLWLINLNQGKGCWNLQSIAGWSLRRTGDDLAFGLVSEVGGMRDSPVGLSP